MFTTGLMRLHQAGKVTNARKGDVRRASRSRRSPPATAELYEWLDGERRRALPPGRRRELARGHRPQPPTWSRSTARSPSTSHGQVVADTIGGTQFSGIGGHEDFVAGVGPRARGPVADLPARRPSTVDGARHLAHRGPAARRARSSRRPATSSTSSSPSTASPSCGAARSASGPGARRHRPPRLPRRAPRSSRGLARRLNARRVHRRAMRTGACWYHRAVV